MGLQHHFAVNYFGKVVIFRDVILENSIVCGRYGCSWCRQVMGVLEVGGNQ